MDRRGNNEWRPNFIGIGAMKAASSWLYNSLVEHPEIGCPKIKELHFFNNDANYKKGIDFYKSKFPEAKIIGELSPSYLFDSRSPARIAEHFPDVKLFVCFRDPAQRAWSHYQYSLQQKGRLSAYKSFSDAYKKDTSLSGLGRYGEQLQRYRKYFDEDQLHVVFYEDIKQEPYETVRGLYRFIGVENKEFSPSTLTGRRNQTGDRIVNIRHKRTWGILVSARAMLSKLPGIEAHLVRSGVVSKVKNLIRASDNTVILKTPKSPKNMTASDRKMVIEDLIGDINLLESLTSRDLTAWKSL